MNAITFTNLLRSPEVRQRGFVTLATLLGVGAMLAVFALSSSTASTGVAMAPTAAAPASSDITAPAGVSPATTPAAVPSAAVPAVTAPVAAEEAAAEPEPTHPTPTPTTACGGLNASVDAFMQHVYAAHLEASPGQQVADALAVDQYVKTHTVMIENMIKPLAGSDLSSC